jgi:spermidine/putrescine transport system substrate-binding protein
MTAAAILSACGITTRRSGTRPSPTSLPPLAHELEIAQWPLYIDKKTIPNFEADSGIAVKYREVISDNQEFFAVISESLSAGQPTGFDLVALSDWVVAKLNRLGWMEPLDHSLLPTVQANLREAYRDPPYDPGNAHSVPWQGGITGIGYNRSLAGRTISSFTDLWDPELAGHVGMLTEMVDTMSMTLLSLGIEPETATVEDAERATERLLEQRDAGIVRGYYGNDYIDGLGTGDLWATMAWSGDVFFLQQDNPDLEFVIPEEGGIKWVTPMEIPLMAEHPRDAHVFLDYVYQPEVAADITSWVGYISPVPAVQDVLQERASSAGKGQAAYLEALATSPLVFPTPETEATLHTYRVFSAEEEEAWNDLFQQVTQG